MSTLEAVVLAAGHGTRMKSALPKILHSAAGRPLVYYPVQAALGAGARRVVVVLSPSTREAAEQTLVQAFGAERVTVCVQDPPRGTGDAARIGLEHVTSERVLVLYGDTPLLASEELALLAGALGEQTLLALLSCEIDDPSGYGRVLRDDGGYVREVREHKDLRTDSERAVREINAGVYAASTSFLRSALTELRPNNAQGELYLTDVVATGAGRGPSAARAVRANPDVLLGVNDRWQLAQAEEILFRRIAERHARAGATIRGDARIDDSVAIEQDAVIEPGTRLRGKTTIGRGATVDVGSVVTDSEIGEAALIKPYSVITESSVGPAAQIGPFAHLRPGSQIDEQAHVGNFVETKQTRLRRGAKANHLAYLGDGDVGERANVGAGTIFCNYDGFRKHRTVIGAGAFIGSDSQLVAPVTIGKGAYVATGTTVTKDVPDEALAVGRARQENKPGYAPRLKARLAAQKK
jgi:bifunctional UDP-N-acetylglucosamine pyrophosphorylase / glucosamine-1-phosphate N-acetyltransferase